MAEQQRLEILKALARGARILILDEPTSGLAPAEIDDLLRWTRQFANRGGTVILVTHKLPEALAVANDVTVLRRGRIVHVERIRREGAAPSTIEQLARAIFPDAPQSGPRDLARVAPGPAVLDMQDVAVSDKRGVPRLQNVSLQVRRGELLGVAAVEGSGHRELLAVAAGLLRPMQGRVELPSNIALIPADRARHALIPDFTLVENIRLWTTGLAGPATRRRSSSRSSTPSSNGTSGTASSSSIRQLPACVLDLSVEILHCHGFLNKLPRHKGRRRPLGHGRDLHEQVNFPRKDLNLRFKFLN